MQSADTASSFSEKPRANEDMSWIPGSTFFGRLRWVISGELDVRDFGNTEKSQVQTNE